MSLSHRHDGAAAGMVKKDRRFNPTSSLSSPHIMHDSYRTIKSKLLQESQRENHSLASEVEAVVTLRISDKEAGLRHATLRFEEKVEQLEQQLTSRPIVLSQRVIEQSYALEALYKEVDARLGQRHRKMEEASETVRAWQRAMIKQTKEQAMYRAAHLCIQRKAWALFIKNVRRKLIKTRRCKSFQQYYNKRKQRIIVLQWCGEMCRRRERFIKLKTKLGQRSAQYYGSNTLSRASDKRCRKLLAVSHILVYWISTWLHKKGNRQRYRNRYHLSLTHYKNRMEIFGWQVFQKRMNSLMSIRRSYEMVVVDRNILLAAAALRRLKAHAVQSKKILASIFIWINSSAHKGLQALMNFTTERVQRRRRRNALACLKSLSVLKKKLHWIHFKDYVYGQIPRGLVDRKNAYRILGLLNIFSEKNAGFEIEVYSMRRKITAYFDRCRSVCARAVEGLRNLLSDHIRKRRKALQKIYAQEMHRVEIVLHSWRSRVDALKNFKSFRKVVRPVLLRKAWKMFCPASYLKQREQNKLAVKQRARSLLRWTWGGILIETGHHPKAFKLFKKIVTRWFVRSVTTRKAFHTLSKKKARFAAYHRAFLKWEKYQCLRRRLRRAFKLGLNDFKFAALHRGLKRFERFIIRRRKFLMARKRSVIPRARRTFQLLRARTIVARDMELAIIDKTFSHYYKNVFLGIIRRLRKNMMIIRRAELVVKLRKMNIWYNWHQNFNFRSRLRSSIARVASLYAFARLRPRFHELKRHSEFERVAFQRLVVTVTMQMRKAIKNLKEYHGINKRLQYSDDFHLLMIFSRVIKYLQFGVTQRQMISAKRQFVKSEMNKFYVCKHFQKLFQNRCEQKADRLFRMTGRLRFFRAVRKYWSLVVKSIKANNYSEGKKVFLSFLKWKRLIRRRIRMSRIMRRCYPYYLRMACCRFLRRLCRITRINLRIKKYGGVHDRFHLRCKKLKVIHLLDLAVNCKWARRELFRLELIHAKKALYRRVFRALRRQVVIKPV